MNSLLINLILLTLTNMEQLPEQNLEADGSAPKNFASFTGKYLCWSLFFTKLQAFRPATLLKRDSYTGVFLWNLRNSEEHLFRKTSERLLLCIDYFIIYIFTILYSIRFSFLQITSSLLRNSNNRTNDGWGGFLWRSISVKTNFIFWRLKISFTEMFHESSKNILIGI